MKTLKTLTAAALMFAATSANAVLFDWTWTGNGGYSASGTMSYSDSLIGTGIINSGQIDTLTIEGFDGGTSLFTWDLATGVQGNPFRLSFDTNTETLNFGGSFPSAPNAVVWGDDGGTSGPGGTGALICGSGSCGITGAGGGFRGSRSVSQQSQFVFTRASASSVPEPTAIALLGVGLAFAGIARRRRRA